MRDAEAPPAPSGSAWASPFAIFGYGVIVAAAFALFEMSYYAGHPALSSATLGTIAGVVAALIAFFVIGLRAPPNE